MKYDKPYFRKKFILKRKKNFTQKNIFNFDSIFKFGTLEPKISNKKNIPDLVLVPLVAFDNKLNRIGYGKGYYDRSLQKIRKIKKNSIFLGIAFYFQKCSTIPVNKNDFKLDCILTERGIISSAN